MLFIGKKIIEVFRGLVDCMQREYYFEYPKLLLR